MQYRLVELVGADLPRQALGQQHRLGAGYVQPGETGESAGDQLGREPTAPEIARDLDLTGDEVEHIRRSAQTPVSLEKPVGDEDESEFGHFITDENMPLPDEEAEITMRKETLGKILGTLSSRERQVLELRYGLDGQHPRTLDEVGRTFNVTRERIRQIENQSLKKLRALAEAVKLRDVA